jgi:hypothetical protein
MINKILFLGILVVSINLSLIFLNSYDGGSTLFNDPNISTMTPLTDYNYENQGTYGAYNPDQNSFIQDNILTKAIALLGDFFDLIKTIGSLIFNLFFGTFTIGTAIGLPFIVVVIMSIPIIILSAIGIFYLLAWGISTIAGLR